VDVHSSACKVCVYVYVYVYVCVMLSTSKIVIIKVFCSLDWTLRRWVSCQEHTVGTGSSICALKMRVKWLV
jgi:hypothetical protein